MKYPPQQILTHRCDLGVSWQPAHHREESRVSCNLHIVNYSGIIQVARMSSAITTGAYINFPKQPPSNTVLAGFAVQVVDKW